VGGIIGVTPDVNAVEKWTLMAHLRVSGHIVKSEHRKDILDARNIGNESTAKFLSEQIVKQNVSFLDTINKLNLHTFASENKKLKISRKPEPTIILKDHQQLFSKLLTVSTSHQIDCKEVLTHELSAHASLTLPYHWGNEKNKQKPTAKRARKFCINKCNRSTVKW